MRRIGSFSAMYPESSRREYGADGDALIITTHKDGALFRYSFRLRLGKYFRSEYQTDTPPFRTESQAIRAAEERVLKCARSHAQLLARLTSLGFSEEGSGQPTLF